MNIGEAIRLEREANGFTVEDLAQMCDKSPAIIEDWEGRQNTFNFLSLLQLRRIGLDPLARMVAAERGVPDDYAGLPIDCNDADGRPIRVGDWLHFDIREWRCGCAGPRHDAGCDGVFQITLIGGEIRGNGAPSDWSEFCRVIPKRQAEVTFDPDPERMSASVAVRAFCEDDVARQEALLAPDAPWRKDPRAAAEAVTGLRWVREMPDWAQLADGKRGVRCADWGVHVGWAVYKRCDGKDKLCEVPGGECGPAVRAASMALVEGVLLGAVILPEGCPGLNALEDF